MFHIDFCDLDVCENQINTLIQLTDRVYEMNKTTDTYICIYRGDIKKEKTLPDTLYGFLHMNKRIGSPCAFGFHGGYYFPKDVGYDGYHIDFLNAEGCIIAHHSYFTPELKSYLTTFVSNKSVWIYADILLSNWLDLQGSLIQVHHCPQSYTLSPINCNHNPLNALEILAEINLVSDKKKLRIESNQNALTIGIPYKYHYIENLYKVQPRSIALKDNLALFIESRYHDSYRFLFRQMARFLPPSFSIMILVTPNVYNQYKALINTIDINIHVVKLQAALTSRIAYNKLMMHISFWERFSIFKRILILQSDTMIYQHGIEHYLEYDYIGSPWPIDYKITSGVGNGRFSIRNVAATLDCLRKMDTIPSPIYERSATDRESLDGMLPEDVFFSHAMAYLGYKVAPFQVAYTFASESCYQHTNIIGSHQLDIFQPKLYRHLLINSIVPYMFIGDNFMTNHRYGWSVVKEWLSYYFDNKSGVLFFGNGEYVLTNRCDKPWVGIFHTTPLKTSKYYSVCNLIKNIQSSSVFLHNIKHCVGIFTLSNYLSDVFHRLFAKIGISGDKIPIQTLYHPITLDNNLFDPKKIDSISQIVFMGSQLRRQSIIFRLNAPGYKKIWLPGRSIESAHAVLKDEVCEYNETITWGELNSVSIQHVPNAEFDEIINNSFLVIYQINASANNSIVEAIARNIPIFCNRLPAVEEYLGTDYPLYFETVAELESLIGNRALIHKAHEYLVSREDLKDKLTYHRFLHDILNSDITRNIQTQQIMESDLQRAGLLHADLTDIQ